jgi:hypothetical protein
MGALATASPIFRCSDARREGTHSVSTQEQRGYQIFPVLDAARIETALRAALAKPFGATF